MPVIKLSAFAGEKPLITARLLPDTAATAAFNARLNDGALTPSNKPVPTGHDAGDLSHKTIYRHLGEWLSWSGVVSAAPGPVAEERLYYTGDGVPKMRVSGVVYNLAVPRPTATPVAAASGTGSGDTQSRTYVWTWVTDFSEESAPSPASAIIDWKPGQTVTLSGFEAAPTGRAISRQRIYRSQTGSSGTFLYLIADRVASAANFVDNIAVDAFQEPLPSSDWNAPVDGLSGLTVLPNGMMAAFSGKSVYFCEPYRPHAWPEKYSQACETEVVGLRAIGTGLVVMTKGQPYFWSGSTPDTMQGGKLEGELPCINARGIVDLGFAICYPSNLGLVIVRADGSIAIATMELFDRDTWLAFDPTSIVAAQHMSNYVMFYSTLDPAGQPFRGCLMLNVNAAQYLVRGTEVADAVFSSPDDQGLYFKRAGETGISRFDSPDGAPDTLYWRSKEFWLTRPVSMGAILIDLGDGLTLKSQLNIDAEHAEIDEQNVEFFAAPFLSAINERPINALAINDDPMLTYPSPQEIQVNVYADKKLVCSVAKAGAVGRLPAGFTARCWEVDVSCNIQVDQVIIAGTVDELRNAV